jgi:hypothetical protein
MRASIDRSVASAAPRPYVQRSLGGLSLIESIFDAFHFIGKALGKIRAKFRCTRDASTGREQHADD